MWEFREDELTVGWTWVELDRNGDELRQSQRSFQTWFGAVADATAHGFDHSRHTFAMREAACGGIPPSSLDERTVSLYDLPT